MTPPDPDRSLAPNARSNTWGAETSVSPGPRVWARPVVVLVVAHMAGIALGGAFPGETVPAAVVCALAAGAASISFIRRRPALISPLLLLAGLGYLTLQPLVADAPRPGHIAARIGKGPSRIVGVVATDPVVSNGRQRFVLEVERAGGENRSIEEVSGFLRVTAAGEGPLFTRGDRLRFASRIYGFRNFENPGGFDYRRYMALKGIRASAYQRAADIKLAAPARPGLLYSFRKSFTGFIDAQIEMPAAAILKALLVGDRQGVGPELRGAFDRAGVSHILAISGLHMGIVAGSVFFAICRLFAFVPFLLEKAWTRKAAALSTIAAVVAYGMLAGMSPSTQRAVVMVCTFMVALVFGRQADSINTLAVAALAILVFDPGALFSVSFQLSFAAVGVILYGLEAGRRPAFIDRIRGRTLHRAALFVYVSFLAMLGTFPLTAFYFNRVALVGLAANCVAIPLIGFIVVPLGLLTVPVFVVSPAAAEVGLHAAARVVDAAVACIGVFADLPYAALRVVTPSLAEIGIYGIFLFAAMNLHRKKGAAVVAAAALLLAGADGCYWIQERLWHSDLRVTTIDVGQGSASLLELPRGRCMLIDGGGFSDNRIFDVGAAVVGPLLWRKKIRTVDTVVLSHPNSDHLNGLIFIVENFHVGQVWTNGQAADTIGYRRFMDALAKGRTKAPAFSQIPRRQRLGGVDLELVYPPADFMERADRGPWRDCNNNSIVIRATFGDVSFLFPGDTKAAAEREMVALGCRALSSTVLTAPHHGSRTSSTPAYLDCVGPEVVVVSSGWRWRRYFPHPVVRERYRKRRLRLYATHRHGAVTVATDGRRYRIRTVLDKPAGLKEAP